uniref:J domain-containing protein n=1 Tax=Odontella aurita TaxID=265563 RepID=A0A6U6L697_9STRA|mmetsp:Transcript_6687/g.19784  ORF Transcript_6687/g.19784 Transcript_6687/m.19784 type:complete len:150 (+) Transcript_6687:1686-2135(+)
MADYPSMQVQKSNSDRGKERLAINDGRSWQDGRSQTEGIKEPACAIERGNCSIGLFDTSEQKNIRTKDFEEIHVHCALLGQGLGQKSSDQLVEEAHLEAKQNFREGVHQHHPDRGGNSTRFHSTSDKWNKVKVAYEVICDAGKCHNCDR